MSGGREQRIAHKWVNRHDGHVTKGLTPLNTRTDPLMVLLTSLVNMELQGGLLCVHIHEASYATDGSRCVYLNGRAQLVP